MENYYSGYVYFVDYSLKSTKYGIYKIITRRFDKKPSLKDILDFKIKESFGVKFKFYKRYYDYYKSGFGSIINITSWIDLNLNEKKDKRLSLLRNLS